MTPITQINADLRATVWGIIQYHKGKKNAINQHDLAAQAGHSPRRVRGIIKLLIEEDHRMICSDYSEHGGYFLPETDAEKEETRALLCSHATSIFKRYRALGFDVNELQMELFGQKGEN